MQLAHPQVCLYTGMTPPTSRPLAGPCDVVGPLGFEPRTDGLKVSGSSFKTAGKQQGKRRSQATFQPKEHTCANVAAVRALTAASSCTRDMTLSCSHSLEYRPHQRSPSPDVPRTALGPRRRQPESLLLLRRPRSKELLQWAESIGHSLASEWARHGGGELRGTSRLGAGMPTSKSLWIPVCLGETFREELTRPRVPAAARGPNSAGSMGGQLPNPNLDWDVGRPPFTRHLAPAGCGLELGPTEAIIPIDTNLTVIAG